MKKKYVSPSISVNEMVDEAALLAASGGIIIPSGPGKSVDEGTGAARPYSYSVWDYDTEED